MKINHNFKGLEYSTFFPGYSTEVLTLITPQFTVTRINAVRNLKGHELTGCNWHHRLNEVTKRKESYHMKMLLF